MEALQTLIPLLITLSLAGLVLAVGLNASREDLFYVLTRPGKLYRAVIAVLVAPPIVAGLLIAFLPLEPIAKAAIMLMAISPVPPLVPGKELAVGGPKNYAYGLYVAMALLTIMSVPIAMAAVTSLFGRHDGVAFGRIAQTVLLGVILPLSIGVGVRMAAPGFAKTWWRRIYQISMVLVFAAFIPVIIKVWSALSSLVGNGTLGAMALTTAVTLFIGHLLGGPDLRDRATLAVASSVRHPGIAMSIAAANFQEPRVGAAILLFLLVGLVVSFPYTAWIKHQLPPNPGKPPAPVLHA